jgi:hypothetical protein
MRVAASRPVDGLTPSFACGRAAKHLALVYVGLVDYVGIAFLPGIVIRNLT